MPEHLPEGFLTGSSMTDTAYLHRHPQFKDLIQIVSDEKKIVPQLVEKDYWIMHCLWGLQQQKFQFEL
jgi:hypothetical protein